MVSKIRPSNPSIASFNDLSIAHVLDAETDSQGWRRSICNPAAPHPPMRDLF